jgi:hypothetical protein
VDLYLYFIYVERGNNGGNQCLVAMGVVWVL